MSGREFSISVGGRTVEAKWWGPEPEAALTLVLLHEGLGCMAMWRDFPARVAEATGCGVLAYSRFGYGQSDPVSLPRPLRYMHDEALDVLGKVMDAALVRRAILVGHSDGGSIAAIYAGGVRDFRLRGVAMIAAHFFTEEMCVIAIEGAKRAYETTNLRDRLARYHRDVDNAFWGWNGAWLDPEFRHWRIDDYVPTIRVPALLIQGSADEYGTLAQFEAFTSQAYCPVETVVVEGAGHSPHLSHQAAVLAAVAEFVARILALEEVPSRAMQNRAMQNNA